MKQLLFILALLIGTCFATHAKTIKLVPSALDSTRMDTVVISDLQDVDEDQNATMHNISSDFGDWNSGPPTSVAIVALIICCGLPFFIVAIVLWFRYKNKQAKYKLAAEALAAGRTIPAELFNDPEEQGNAVMTKGIKNIFLGIGLGVFLWVLTEEEGLAAIGFLIFCMGLGQVLIAYTTTPHKKKKDDPFPPTRINQDENGAKSMKIENIELERNEEAKETQNIKNNLVKKYQSPIRRFFLHQTLGDTELSDDLAQETFIKAYTNLASFKNLSSFSTWLYRIAYNIFYDYIRSKKETSGLETWEIDAVYQTEQRQVGEHMDIYRGLSQLKEVERTCITLFFMEDLPIEKIAVITGMPAGTIKSHLSRGKTKLTTFLKQNGYDGKR